MTLYKEDKMHTITVQSVRKYKIGYEVRTEIISGLGPPFIVKSAYTTKGEYLGDAKIARFLMVKYGIKPEYRTKTSRTCSIGYSKKHKKWFSWSHRALFGFGVGAVWNGKYIKSMKDAKLAAKQFAKSIS